MSLSYKETINNVLRNNSDYHPISVEERNKLQDCLYEMACDLDDRCRKNNLHLFMVGGTLLGAVRHKGFIPWDDDIDLALSRKEYQKLIKIFDKEFSDLYELRCPNTKSPNGNRFMQIYKKGTVLKSFGNANPLQPESVYIDVFPYDYVHENFIMRTIRGMYSNMLMVIASSVMDYYYPNNIIKELLNTDKKGKVLNFVREIIGRLFCFKKPEEWFSMVDSAIDLKTETKLITSATGRKHYFGEIYPTSIFFPLKELKFKNHTFYTPNKYHDYLVGLYGDDYMMVPEINERESHFISEIMI